MSEAHKKHLTREELKEKALEWFQPAQPAQANFLSDKEGGSGEATTVPSDGAGAIAASVVMAMIPLVVMLLK